MNYRPGSKRAKVFAAFKSGGVGEALKIGHSLGWSEAIVQSFVKKWKDGATLRPTIVRSTIERQRVYVYDKGDAEVLATVIQEGSEFSIVRWDRADLFGKTSYINNRHLHPTKK